MAKRKDVTFYDTNSNGEEIPSIHLNKEIFNAALAFDDINSGLPYMNERIYGCEKVTASDGDEYYANCKSEFLNKLKTDSGEHDTGQYGNYDLDYDGVSKYNKK